MFQIQLILLQTQANVSGIAAVSQRRVSVLPRQSIIGNFRVQKKKQEYVIRILNLNKFFLQDDDTDTGGMPDLVGDDVRISLILLLSISIDIHQPLRPVRPDDQLKLTDAVCFRYKIFTHRISVAFRN